MSSIYRNYDLSRITNAKYMGIRIPFTLYSIIATWFFVGRIGIASGTLGSIAFYPLYYCLLLNADSMHDVRVILWGACIILFFAGWWAIWAFQEKTRTYDHSCVVIDEVIGMNLTLAISFGWLMDISPVLSTVLSISEVNITFILALILFRIFDIKKPFFIGYVDRYYKSPFGVILDDLLAACFASTIFFAVYQIYAYFRYF